jgi:hypothetical protein
LTIFVGFSPEPRNHCNSPSPYGDDVPVVRVDPRVGAINRAAEGFDIIGDVHGCHSQLLELLHTLGYRDDSGAFRHPTRRLIFVGDLIDRGPEQVAVIDTVKAMHSAGSAHVLMGNHEFNAVCWATPSADGDHLRRHTDKNRAQHLAFLNQIGEGSASHGDAIAWFRTLPLWLEIDGLRVVHACWDTHAIEGLGSPTLEPDDFIAASERDSDMYRWVENICKGPEVKLPDGHEFSDKDGHRRAKARYRWWTDGDGTYRTMCEVPGDVVLPDLPIDPAPVQPYGGNEPVFFGHYWRQWHTIDLTDRTACLDYSAVKGGPLVAYRWSGETTLDQHNLVGATR